MIRFLNGGATSDREQQFVELIYNSAKNGRKVLVIIPDQFSFEYDKKLYNRLGAIKFNKIITAGFNRLAELLESKYGGFSSTSVANENAKLILMYKTIKTLRADGQICYYTKMADKKGLEKGNFISQLIELVGQLRESGITYEDISAAAVKLSGSLALKMTDISRIYTNYMKQLEAQGLHDSISSISASVKTARENGFFKGFDVYINAFSGFTYDEIKMIELCFAQADNVTVSLVIDSDCVKNRINPFKMPQTTFGILKSMAQNFGYEIIQTHETQAYENDIAYVGKNLLNVTKKKFDGKSCNVRVLNADDIYSEASFVCAQIKHHRQEGYLFSDIALVLRNIDDCAGVFEGMLEKYDIPYFIDRPDRVSASSIVHYFTAVFNCITSKKYKTENILKLVKSPFFTSKKHDANNIEQYCRKWNIDGDMWTKEYFGLDISHIKQESMLAHVQSIEKLRKRIIDPFEKIRRKCAPGEIPASQMCESFFELLDDMRVSQRTYSVVSAASQSGNDTQLELSRGLRQLWNSILSVVKSIYDCLNDDPISLRQFYELFRVMVSQISVSNPPQKMDCIRIADAAHSRLSNIKIAFVCQVNDGVFPKSVTNSSLLSNADVSKLKKVIKNIGGSLSIGFGADVRNTLMREEYICYNAVTAATQKLYMTYTNADLTGEELLPSTLVSEVLNCFESKNSESISQIPLSFFCTSAKTAFHTALEHFRDDDPEVEAIIMSLNATPYADKIAAVRNGADKLLQNAKTTVDKDVCVRAFFKDSVATISASQIDSYYKCPFGYFCKYGLKLAPIEVMDMSANHKGTLVHKVLEIVFSKKDDMGEFIILKDDEKTDEFIRQIISDCFDEYYNEELNSDFGKSKQFDYNYEQLKSVAYTIVKYVQAEIASSSYTPVQTEYSFGKTPGGRAIKLETQNGRLLSVTGSIDRVDKSENGGQEFIRIIDYKTGKITLDEAQLMCGLNLQMLVYLDAYLKCENSSMNTVPAAIEYMSFGNAIDSFYDSSAVPSEYKKIEQENIIKAFKPKGIVAGSPEIIKTFEGKNNPQFMYSPFKSNRTDTVSAEEFDAIRRFAEQKVVEFGNALESGRFPMNAVGTVCNYCDYRSVCGKEKYGDTSGIENNKKELSERFKSTIGEIVAENKGGDS